jgi:hypothetical protein
MVNTSFLTSKVSVSGRSTILTVALTHAVLDYCVIRRLSIYLRILSAESAFEGLLDHVLIENNDWDNTRYLLDCWCTIQ